MIKMWPQDADILMNWDEDSLEELQDPTLAQEAEKQYNEMMENWNTLYECLSKYPDVFQPSSISFNRFKWVYIIAASRCFSSSWSGVSQMIPFADQINHENVNVTYDCRDPITGVYFPSSEQLEKMDEAVRKDKQSSKEQQLIKDFREEMTDMNQQLD